MSPKLASRGSLNLPDHPQTPSITLLLYCSTTVYLFSPTFLRPYNRSYPFLLSPAAPPPNGAATLGDPADPTARKSLPRADRCDRSVLRPPTLASLSCGCISGVNGAGLLPLPVESRGLPQRRKSGRKKKEGKHHRTCARPGPLHFCISYIVARLLPRTQRLTPHSHPPGCPSQRPASRKKTELICIRLQLPKSQRSPQTAYTEMLMVGQQRISPLRCVHVIAAGLGETRAMVKGGTTSVFLW